MTERIFLSAPDVRQRERDYVSAVIDSNWLAPAGPELSAFEDVLCAATGREHAVALASGTGALHLALLLLGIGPGDDILCSTLTFVASANPILYCGASPVFIDSEPDGWNMDPNLLAEELERRAAINDLPKAAVVVDIYGMCANYTELAQILGHYEVPLIEDAAESLGSSHQGESAGSFGEHAILSFNGNKLVTSSGGGALVTDDAQAADRVRFLSTQAREPARHYEHREVGYNYRMSSLCAALGRAQLEEIDDRIARRRAINLRYSQLFAAVPGIEVMEPPTGTTQNFWLTCCTVDPETAPATRNAIIERLDENNIESRPVWKPMHLQPLFADAYSVTHGRASHLFDTGLCLPSGSGMSTADLDRVLHALATLVEP